MRREILKILVCPKCGSPLRLVSVNESKVRIHEGNLDCLKCGVNFKILDDTACFLPQKDVDRMRVIEIENIFKKEIKKKWLKQFQWQERRLIKEEWKWMFNKLNLNQSKIHLDWGTGIGRFLREILKKPRGEVVVLEMDFSTCIGLKESLEKLGKYFRISFICADARNMPFKDSSIDSISSWHCLDQPRIRKAIDESRRVLKNGKTMVASGFFIKGKSEILKVASRAGMEFVKEGAASLYFRGLRFKSIEYKIFFEGKWSKRKNYLPRFGDYYYYVTYEISGKK